MPAANPTLKAEHRRAFVQFLLLNGLIFGSAAFFSCTRAMFSPYDQLAANDSPPAAFFGVPMAGAGLSHDGRRLRRGYPLHPLAAKPKAATFAIPPATGQGGPDDDILPGTDEPTQKFLPDQVVLPPSIITPPSVFPDPVDPDPVVLPPREPPYTPPDPTSPLPEPMTWANMILGFATIGGALRWRRQRKSAENAVAKPGFSAG